MLDSQRGLEVHLPGENGTPSKGEVRDRRLLYGGGTPTREEIDNFLAQMERFRMSRTATQLVQWARAYHGWD